VAAFEEFVFVGAEGEFTRHFVEIEWICDPTTAEVERSLEFVLIKREGRDDAAEVACFNGREDVAGEPSRCSYLPFAE